MKKQQGSWSGMRKYLEQEMLCPGLQGRVRYDCTSYAPHDYRSKMFRLLVDGAEVKRFCLESVNAYFCAQGLKAPAPHLEGVAAYWEGFWPLLQQYSILQRTEYTDEEFCTALGIYRSQDIGASIRSENPIVLMFALLDRRVGIRTLQQLQDRIHTQPDWVQKIYCLRTEDS